MNTKKLAIGTIVVIVIISGLLLLNPELTQDAGLYINGEKYEGFFANFFGLSIAFITILCVAILLLFVFTGIGAILLASFVFIATVLAAIAVPLLLPIIIPLLAIFTFVYFQRKKSLKSSQV